MAALKAEVIRINSIGMPTGIYETVACPKEYRDQFEGDIWIMHPSRQEPVRMISEGRSPEAKWL